MTLRFAAMVARSNVHGRRRSCRATGFVLPGCPSIGSWVCYGLGRLTDNLPAFGGAAGYARFAPNGPANWGAGFLPAAFQGTMVRPGDATPSPICSRREQFLTPRTRRGASLLRQMNQGHAAARPVTRAWTAASPRMSWRRGCNSAAPEVLDISQETQATRRLYGLDQRITEDSGAIA